jgi:cytochrome c556
MNMRLAMTAVLLAALTGAAPAADDARELVKLPPMMRDHMLGNMRDHLLTLDRILGAVSEAKFDDAAKVAEARLGMSSLTAHDAAHMAPFMPKAMQDMGTEMHHAASRLVIVLQDASVTPDAESVQKVAGALHAVTTACTSCHAAYRLQ